MADFGATKTPTASTPKMIGGNKGGLKESVTFLQNESSEFQRDHFSHIPQYLKKAHDPHWALGYHLHATRLIKSGRRPGNAPILFQLIQQLAGFAHGQIFGDISVKLIVH